MNKKIIRLIAVVSACLGMSVFTFTGCKKKDETAVPGSNQTADDNQNQDDNQDQNQDDDNQGGGSGNQGGGSDDKDDGNQGGGSGNQGGGSDDKDDGNQGGDQGGSTGDDIQDPVISGPVQGGPTITKASKGELECAYVEWKAADNAKWYNVYVSPDGANNWTKLDGALVRQYKDYYRADAVGLKAGTYDMKVVPVSGDDTEAGEHAATASKIEVLAHERTGYAFVDGNVPGAYNLDGTLKANAQVVYVTSANAKTVKATVNGTEVAGFQAILAARQKGGIEQTPLCFRIVGTVNKGDLDSIGSSSEGLQLKGASLDKPAANITIEGIGSDGTVNGFGFLIRNCKNIELRNFGIVNFMDDGVSVDTDNSHLWLHNLDIFYGSPGGDTDQAKGDGSLDIKKSQYCTVSYNHFWDSGKCCLLDATAGTGNDASNYMTYHHNWFDHSDSRHARVRNASAVHIYNNYYDGNSKYGVGGATGSSTFVENNYFRSTSNSTKPIMIAGQGTDAEGKGTFSGENGGMIKGYGNTFDVPDKPISHLDSSTQFDYYQAATRSEAVPATYKTAKGGTEYSNFDTASDFYTYHVDTAEEAKANVERYAGRVDGGDLKWDFDDATEDANYSIITELKSKVTSYKGTVIKIGATTVSTGGSTGGTGSGEGGGDTPVNPPATVEGQITYAPETDGTTKTGMQITGNLTDATLTVNGHTYTKALKIESSTSIKFTPSVDMELKVYMNVGVLKVNGTVENATSENGYYVLTYSVKAGTPYELTKKDTGRIFLITLTPKA